MINKIVNNSQPQEPLSTGLSIALTGDLILDVPEPDHWLSGIALILRAADVAIGHLEIPHTNRGVEMAGDVPAPGADPAALAALPRAGFTAVSLAGNHMADQGADGISDTLAGLAQAGLLACGAGLDLQQARAPALINHKKGRIALLSYNCVGPESSWAGAAQAGCAYLRIDTADGSPVRPVAPLQSVTAEARSMLQDDIAAIRDSADIVIVALHKGIVHTPAKLAEYERPLAHAAVDCGADVVVGHHAHILKGIEIYRGKPIFHGLGNGCVVTRALSPGQSHPQRAAWVQRRKELFGFEPDPAYELAPFHPQAINAMVARLVWNRDGQMQAGVVPVHVEAPGRPLRADDDRAVEIVAYVESISTAAGLPPIHFERGRDMWTLQ
jgi:poly-gamma-glutamate capsule biosynthesis protein CapA/YwtB (metallophosphatase superfamily)